MSGFYFMHRGWMDNPAFGGAREPFCRRAAWVWLVENACWQSQRVDIAGRTVTLQRGQLSHSLRFLGQAWGWDNMKVHRFITRLSREKMTEAVTDAGQLVISICNYDKYQASGQTADASTDAASMQQGGSNDANKKEGKEGKKDTDTAYPLSAEPTTAGLDDLFPIADVVRLPDPTAKAVGMWNDLAASHGLSCVKAITKARRAALRLRLKECGGLDGWQAVLAHIASSRWMLGENGRGWKADFDWVLTPSKFTKLMEGTYGNRAKPTPDGQGSKLGYLVNRDFRSARAASATAPIFDADPTSECVQ